MGNRSKITSEELRGVAPEGIATNATLRRAGVSASMIAHRCRPGGPWQRLLPGVILLGRCIPTRRQQLCAAIELAGPRSVITGIDALRAHGVGVPIPRTVRLLVPSNRRLLPKAFLSVERTSRLPDPVIRNGLPFAPPARAAVDVARAATNPALLRSLVAAATEHGRCTADELRAELDAGNQRGSSAVRAALRHFDGAVATLLHRRARDLLRHAPLPPPRWNVTLYDRKRRPIGYTDAWWDEVGMAWQLCPEDLPPPRTPGSYLALSAAGVIVVRTPAGLLNDAAESTFLAAQVIKDLTAAFFAAARRPRPRLLYGCAALPNTA